MDEFCGSVSQSWGPMRKEWFTSCFDDLVLFGLTYAFLFVFGSYRVWSLKSIPAKADFPYSTRHSVKVMILAWLGTLPLLIFAVKYANKSHSDFEWVAKPLASLAWFYSLWIMNLETERDIKECWILRTYWILSAIAATLALPTIVLHSEAHGYGKAFYVYLVQYFLYIAIAVCAVRFTHKSGQIHPNGQTDSGGVRIDSAPKDAPVTVLSTLWWDYTWRMFSLFAPEKTIIAIGMLCTCLSAPLGALALVILGRLFNNFYYPYSSLSAQSHLRDYCLYLIVIYTATCFLDALFTMALYISGERMAARTRRRVFHSLMRQELSFFDEERVEKVKRTLTHDILIINRALTEQFGHGMSCVITVVVSLTIQFFISWKLTLVSLTIGPICVLAIVLQKHFSSDLKANRNDRLDRAASTAREALENIRVVRGHGGEESEDERFHVAVKSVYDLAFRHGVLESGTRSMVSLMFQLSVSLILYIGGILVLRHNIEVGYLVTLFALEIIMISSVAQLPDLIAQFQSALTTSEAIFELLDRSSKMNTKGGQVLEMIDGNLIFSGVHFSSPTPDHSIGSTTRKSHQILSNVQLDIKPGKTAVIAGAPGSGKSTIAALTQRLYDVDDGIIMLDGRDIRDLDLFWLREHIGLVPQHPVVFSMTIANNIGYGADGMSQTTVEKAARASGAHEWIQALPDGYQALVGERGVRLTAAQSVQIAIARALAIDPKILVLDDCLTVLDAATQQIVIDEIERIMARRTLIILTSTVIPVRAQQFWVLRNKEAVSVTNLSEMEEMLKIENLALSASPDVAAKMTILNDMEENIMSQVKTKTLDSSRARNLSDLITDIKEALTLESQPTLLS